MKCFVAVLGLLALAKAHPGLELATYSYANPAGVTYRGVGFNPGFALGPAQPVAAAPVAAPAFAYAHQPVAAVAPQPALAYAHAPVAPAVAVTQKVGYAHHQIPVQVPGVADVPVTKLALTQGVTQKLVDVAQPAVTNRRVKVRRPALRKEFYDIEHRVIVRPAGSATLELSQPIAKEQKGPAVLTPTNYQQIAPVVRYGLTRQILDGPEVSPLAHARANIARGAGPAGPLPPPPQTPQAAPQQAPQQFAPQPQQAPEFATAPEFRGAAPEFRSAPPPQPPQQAPQPQPSPAPRQRPLQLRPQQEQQQQQQPQPQPQPQFPPQNFFRSNDAEIVDAGFAPQPAPAPQQPRPVAPPAPQPHPAPAPGGRALALPDMPVEIQARLLELLSAKGGTVTEVLNENGQPANSASVLQVADALQDVNLQGGEKITTRRIVVTRPIETIQEIDIQEPATKIHRQAINVPTLFKTPVQGVARVPVSLPGVKNVATPVLQTSVHAPVTQYAAAPVQYAAHAHAPAFAY